MISNFKNVDAMSFLKTYLVNMSVTQPKLRPIIYLRLWLCDFVIPTPVSDCLVGTFWSAEIRAQEVSRGSKTPGTEPQFPGPEVKNVQGIII